MTWLSDLIGNTASVLPKIILIEGGRYVATAGAVTLVISVLWRGYFRARKIQPRSAQAQDYRREILASLRTVLIFSVTGFSLYLAAKAGWITVYGDFAVAGPVYFGVTLVLMTVAHDTYFYWTHRAMHQPRLFRMFHRTHHKSRIPTPWAAYAFDIPEALVIVGRKPRPGSNSIQRSNSTSGVVLKELFDGDTFEQLVPFTLIGAYRNK